MWPTNHSINYQIKAEAKQLNICIVPFGNGLDVWQPSKRGVMMAKLRSRTTKYVINLQVPVITG